MRTFNDAEKDIIYRALVEYEYNHYTSAGATWQKIINRLITQFEKETTNHEKIS